MKRDVGLFGVVAYGVGTIIGAGVYALIGKAAGHAGNSVWISFLLSAAIASFTGMSYAKLSSLFPVSGAEYVYVQRAFRNKFVSFIIGWLVFLSGVISSSAVALGFAGYLRSYTDFPVTLISCLLIVALSVINIIGIRESMAINTVMTLSEILGLLLVVYFGSGRIGTVNYLEAPSGMRGVLSATSLIFFAYLGFEAIVKMGDETKNPARTMPRAIVLSLLVSAALYCLVAITVVGVIPYNQLASSPSPLADVALKIQGTQAFAILSVIALLATANTVLASLIASSRIVYGMAKELSQSAFMRIYSRTGAPYIAVVATMLVSILFAFLGDIELVANVTNLATFIVFAMVNLSVILLTVRRNPDGSSPHSKSLPLSSICGAVLSLVMSAQYDLLVFLITAFAVVIGGLVYVACRC